MAHSWNGTDPNPARTRRASRRLIPSTDNLENRTLLTTSAPVELEPPAMVSTTAMPEAGSMPEAATTEAPQATATMTLGAYDPAFASTTAPVRPNQQPLPSPAPSSGRSMPTDRLASAVLPGDQPARDPAFGEARPKEWGQQLDPETFRASRQDAQANRDPEQRDTPLRIRPGLRVNSPLIQSGRGRMGESSDRLIPIERLQPGEFRAMTPQERSEWMADQRDARNRPRLTGSPETDRAILVASQNGGQHRQPPKSQSDLEKFGNRVGDFFEDSWNSFKGIFGF